MISFVCKLDWRVGVSLLEEKSGKGSLIYMNTEITVCGCHCVSLNADRRYNLLNGCTGVNSFLSSPSISFSCHISSPSFLNISLSHTHPLTLPLVSNRSL